jgi:replicative DNA helicase
MDVLENQFFIDKINKVKAQLGNRKGPNIKWLSEKENDDIFIAPDHTFTNGIPTLARTLSDFESGIVCIAGQPNMGKSSLIVNMMLSAAQLQDDTIVVDLSFDDPLKKRYQQYIASLSGLMYQEITTDCGLSDTKLQLKQSAEDKIVELYTRGSLKTFEATETIDNSRKVMRKYENVFNLMKKLRKENPDKKIIVSIDAWNNLDSSNAKGSELNQVNTQLSELKELSEELNIMVILSAHLRKTTDKRPGIEDIKGTSNMLYDANCAIILRNEYRENLYKDPLLYSEDGKYYPIIVLEIKKTKVSSWDLPLIYGLKSASCQVIPLERYEYIQYYDTLNSKRQ